MSGNLEIHVNLSSSHSRHLVPTEEAVTTMAAALQPVLEDLIQTLDCHVITIIQTVAHLVLALEDLMRLVTHAAIMVAQVAPGCSRTMEAMEMAMEMVTAAMAHALEDSIQSQVLHAGTITMAEEAEVAAEIALAIQLASTATETPALRQ